MSGSRTILCLNSGSSSLKLALFRVGETEERIAEGAAEQIGQPEGRLWIRRSDGTILVDTRKAFPTHHDVFTELKQIPEIRQLPQPDAVGHRVVHGGPRYAEPQLVTKTLIEELRQLIPLAPLHIPPSLEIMEFVGIVAPSVPQVACFDTGFHQTMPDVTRRLPLPRDLYDHGVRRYGFHGLSYEYIVGILGPTIPPATVVAHLGNGASLVALREGKSIDTTMGLTPAGGFMMGTRTGDLDPGVLLYLMRELDYDYDKLTSLVFQKAGMLAVSGSTGDVKRLLSTESTDANAAAALEMFCLEVRKSVASMAASLQGLDLLVFTGGIGERAATIRERICGGLGFLGIRLDLERNAAGIDVISADDSRCLVRVIPTDEDLTIARHTARIA